MTTDSLELVGIISDRLHALAADIWAHGDRELARALESDSRLLARLSIPAVKMTRREIEIWLDRRSTIAEVIREIACRSTVDADSSRALKQAAQLVSATPGVDGTCRKCGKPLPTQHLGRPRVFCDDHSETKAAQARAARRQQSENQPKSS